MGQSFALQSKRFHLPILGIVDPFDQVPLRWLNRIQCPGFASSKRYGCQVQIRFLQHLAFVANGVEQCGLSSTVVAHNSDTISIVDNEVDIL